MMKGLMGQCLNHEMALDRIRKRANDTEDELRGLKAWKVGMDKKFSTSESVRKELEQKVELLEKALADKEKEIKMPRTSSVRQRRQRSVNTMTPMPSWRSSGPLMQTALTTLSIRPRKLILILIFSNLILTHRLKLLLNPSPLRVRRICLLMMQPLATGSLFRL